MNSSQTPWSHLPRGFLHPTGQSLAQAATTVSTQILAEVPVFAAIEDSKLRADAQHGFNVIIGRFFELPGTNSPALTPEVEKVCAELGSKEARDGRGLEDLFAAYRAGARVVLREISAGLKTQESLHPDLFIALTDSVLAFTDAVSAASTEGYTQQRAELAGQHDSARRVVADLLLRGRSEPTTLATLAARAGWPVPNYLRVVATSSRQGEKLRQQLGERALIVDREVDTLALLPVSSLRADTNLKNRLRSLRAVVGVAVPVDQLPTTLPAVEMLLSLLQRNSLPENPRDPEHQNEPPYWVEDYFVSLVAGSSDLVAQMRPLLLHPLESLPAGKRERAEQTLTVWLRNWGNRVDVASELFVHPQTVSYRLEGLRRMFGPALDDPYWRLAASIVLSGVRR